MPSRRVPGPFGLAVTAVTVLSLTACSSGATAGSGSVGSSTAGSGTATSAGRGASSAGGTAASGATGLAYRLHRAISGITSNHLAFTFAAGGQTVRGTGDQKLSQGQLVAYTLTETLPPGGALSLVRIGDRTWAKLPTTASTAKPWVLVRTSSSDPKVQALAQGLQSTATTQSLQTTGTFVSSARSVRDVGPATVDGVRTTRYAVVIDPAKLPADFPQKAAIVSAGLTSIPVDLYVDGKDRPVRTVEHITVRGSTVDTTVSMSRFDAPVTITAPPASEVSTR